MDPLLTAYLALALDLLLGDPPNRFHPVAWTGRVMEVVARRLLRVESRVGLVLGGGVTTAAGIAVLTGFCGLLHLVPVVGDALVLWTCLSVRGLVEHMVRVGERLRCGDLEGARERVRWLVSREVEGLDEGLVASAAVESGFENVLDSLVGPLWWFCLVGWWVVPVYRAVNVADAMFGYRRGRLEAFGKVPARADDALNLMALPCCAAVLTAALPWWVGRASVSGLVRAVREVESPCSWLPMYVGACALRVRLEKRGEYELGPGGRLPGWREVMDAAGSVWVVSLVAPAVTHLFSTVISSALRAL